MKVEKKELEEGGIEGRHVASTGDSIDLEVGLELLKKVGDKVSSEDVCVIIHYNNDSNLAEVISVLRKSFIIVDNEVKKPKLLEEIIKG